MMESLLKLHLSRQLLFRSISHDAALARSIRHSRSHPSPTLIHGQAWTRIAPFSVSSRVNASATASRSSSSSASSNIPDPNKPIVLEQPDKFRPPSHSQRLVKGKPRGSVIPGAGGNGGHNQRSTAREAEAQRTKSYPNMFPAEGTRMHRFLMNRKIHFFITIGILIVCALGSYIETFMLTSPFAKLIPPISTLPFHPIKYFRDCWNVFILQMDYRTEEVTALRADHVLDVQKRRIYRRAHGMEDLDADEEEGVDIRGLVPWDDGYTNKERERGRPIGRRGLTHAEVIALGGSVGDGIDWQKIRDEQEMKVIAEGKKRRAEQRKRAGMPEEEEEEEIRPKRKRKLWLGIW